MSYSRSESRNSRRRGRRSRSASQHNHDNRNYFKQEDQTCLHISNLSSKVVDSDLRDIFDKYGAIDYIKVCMEPRTQVSRGFGFVNFQDHDAAIKALKNAQDTELFGKKIHLEFSKRGQPRRKTPGRYAGYLPRQRSRSLSRGKERSSSSNSYSSRRQNKRRRNRSRSSSHHHRRRSNSYSERRRKDSRSRSRDRKHDKKKRR